ncbi:MAG: hypothetical protein C0508_01195 [Cyanobacteria bacterium PR.023]|nr:hypothetical protein [Cyanobacteria bacterium PR.3.49]MBA4073623.1 hypothetical protein [Cyanobacteria bacterium PR.023]
MAREILNLRDIRETEEEIFRIHQEKLPGHTVELINSLSTTYWCFLNAFDGADFDGHLSDNDAVICCVAGCHYDKDMGLLALLRGHRTDAALYTRRAMEYAAFGIHILRSTIEDKNPDTPSKPSTVYLNSMKSKTAYKRYRSDFQVMPALAKVEGVLSSKFTAQYEELCNEAHASFESLSLRFEKKEDGGYNICYYEIKGDDRIEKVMLRLVQLVEIHLMIINCFFESARACH